MIPQSLKHVVVTSALGALSFLSTRWYTYTFTGKWMCKTIIGWKSLESIFLSGEIPCTYPVTFDIQTTAQEQQGRKPPPTLCTVLVVWPRPWRPCMEARPLAPWAHAARGASGTRLRADSPQLLRGGGEEHLEPWPSSWLSDKSRFMQIISSLEEISQIPGWWETMDSYFLCTFQYSPKNQFLWKLEKKAKTKCHQKSSTEVRRPAPCHMCDQVWPTPCRLGASWKQVSYLTAQGSLQHCLFQMGKTEPIKHEIY